MPRHNSGVDDFTFGSCKIRKRASSSSSSASSSLLQNYRFKRAIMVGKRGGSTTPAPIWRMNPKSPSVGSRISESSRQQGPVSARKLANALWELNKIPSPKFSENLSTRRSKRILQSRPHRLSDPSHSPDSDRSKNSRYSNQRRIMPMVSQRVRCKHIHKALELLSSTSAMEIDAHSQGLTPTSSMTGTKSRLKDLRNGLSSSKELLKLVNRIWGREDQHSYVISLFSALRVELDRAQTQIDHLIEEQKLEHNEISCLKKQFLEEKSLWKIREQERIKSTVHSIMEELELERKLRRRAERLNKKLGLELADTRDTLFKAVKELEKEKEMLQLADEWREERVQMKLSEAKVQFEEKNAAVDQLRNKLEAFLENKRTEEETQLDEKRDSVESNLHSIELNMDGNNKAYNWSYASKVEAKDEAVQRNVSVKKLRDHMLAGTKIVLPHSSPTRQWNRNRTSHETSDRVCEGLKVAEIVKAIKKGGSKARLVERLLHKLVLCIQWSGICSVFIIWKVEEPRSVLISGIYEKLSGFISGLVFLKLNWMPCCSPSKPVPDWRSPRLGSHQHVGGT